MAERQVHSTNAEHSAPYSRDRLTTIALLILVGIGVVLTLIVAGPFIPGLTWALAFAVVAWPLHVWMRARVRNPNVAAGLAVAVVALVLIVPIAFTGSQVATQTAAAGKDLQAQFQSGEWKQKMRQSPCVAGIWSWIEANVKVEQELKNVAASLQEHATRWITGAVWGTIQILIALFALFYFFRDHEVILKVLRSLMPMSDHETDYFFERVRAMTRATIYGTVVVAIIQGVLGGIMFWMLKIPGALLWGVAMAVLSMIPVLGAFVIWAPAAVFLAMQGNWGKALILTAWGTIVVGLIDNLLYPVLVGKEMRLHTLPVFIAIVGGLVVFGAAGLVIGPVILAGTVAVVDILRSRTAYGRSADQPT